MIPPRVCFFDIETGPAEEGGFAPPDNPTGKILAWAIHDNYTNTIFSCVDVSQTDIELESDYIKKALAAPDKYLAAVIPHTKEIAPFTGAVKTIPVHSEYGLFCALEKVLDSLQPDIISGHNVTGLTIRGQYHPGFDREYILNRALKENKKRIVFNKKSPKKVPVYPLMLRWFRDKRGKRQKGVPPLPLAETIWFDGMIAYQLMHEGELDVKGREALGLIAERELGYGKILHPPMMEMAENDPNLLALYNIWDVILSGRIDAKVGLIDYYHTMARKTGVDIDDALHSMPAGRSFILHNIHDRMALPSKGMEPWHNVDVKGGYVAPPANGKFRWVIILDNSGEYPSIVRSLNIDKTSKTNTPDENCSVTPNGNYYRLEPRGVVVSLMDQLAADRAEHQKKMKEAEYNSTEWKYYKTLVRVDKEIMNSISYGVYANKHYQLRDEAIANDITKIARDHVRWNQKIAEETRLPLGGGVAKFKSIAGDTDSIMIIVENLTEIEKDTPVTLDMMIKLGEELAEVINKSFDEFVKPFNITKHFLHIKLEEIDEVFYQHGAKKRYTKLVSWDGRDISHLSFDERQKTKGFETRRSNASQITKDVVKRGLLAVLTNEEDSFYTWIRKEVAEIKSAVAKYSATNEASQLLEDLGTPMGLGTMDTNLTTQQAKGAHYYNQHINPADPLRPSDKARVFLGYVGSNQVININDNMIRTNSFCLRFGEKLSDIQAKLDIDGLLEKCVFKPIENVGLDVDRCRGIEQKVLF